MGQARMKGGKGCSSLVGEWSVLVRVVYISPCKVGAGELLTDSIQLQSELDQNCSSSVLIGSELVRGNHDRRFSRSELVRGCRVRSEQGGSKSRMVEIGVGRFKSDKCWSDSVRIGSELVRG